MYNIQLYKKGNIEAIADAAEVFYKSQGSHDSRGNVKDAILGSQFIAVALEGDEIVGAAKVVGDGVRFSTIVDLVVDNDYRGKGIGTEIIQTLAKACNTFHINLYTDPNDPGLTNFYKKAGFELVEGVQDFEWPKKNV